MREKITSSEARPVRRTFSQLARALEEAEARYAICGTVALGGHAMHRYTEAIDVLVDEPHVESVRAALDRSNVGTDVGIKLLAPIDSSDEWALANRVHARAFERTVWVVSAEGFVLMSLQAIVNNAPIITKYGWDAATRPHSEMTNGAGSDPAPSKGSAALTR